MLFLRPLAAAFKMLLALTLLLGVVYPLAMTGLGMLMPSRAEGSLISVDSRVIGSSLLGQQVSDPRFFQPRPSASGYAGDTSGGTNLPQNSPELASLVREREDALREANPDATGPIPADAVAASSSGLDPHISAEYAAWQTPRVAAETGIPVAEIRALIDEHTTRPALGFIGTTSVNVTELNAALATRLNQGQ